MADDTRQQAFDREFRQQLDRLTEPLVAALRVVTGTPVPAEVGVLAFEAQPYWSGFPVYAFAMAADAPDEVYYESPFSGVVLAGVGDLVPDGAIDQDGYEEAGVDTVRSGARVLAGWFGECWHAAGGAAFPARAVFSLHDDADYFDLTARRWVDQSDVWP